MIETYYDRDTLWSRHLMIETYYDWDTVWLRNGGLFYGGLSPIPISELLRTYESWFIKIPKGLYKVRLFIVVELMYIIPFSIDWSTFWSIPKHSPHAACCFPQQLLVCYFQLCNSGYKALQWSKWDLLCEMRTISPVWFAIAFMEALQKNLS